MPEQIPLKTPKITQKGAPLSVNSTELYTDVVILLDRESRLGEIPFADVIRARMRDRATKLSPDRAFVTDLPNRRGTRVTVALVDPTADTFARLTRAREINAGHAGTTALALACYGDVQLTGPACEALVAAALARAAAMPSFQSKPEKKLVLGAITLYGAGSLPLKRLVAEANGNHLARYLTTLPANELTPRQYRKRIETLARSHGWQSRFLDLNALRRLGAGAFLAVAQGSPEGDAGILHLRYRPRGRTSQRLLALVGKGICFDTGGTNLKGAKHMYGMHEDMEGSAVALGTLLALSELGISRPVDCWLAIAQNHIGPNAYKQNDVVTAANGNTIEVVHTDAEGRMVLADALQLAARANPQLIIDYATLTGSCIQALGTRMSGAFTNRPALIPKLIEAGRNSGERIWPFPLEPDYEQHLKSDVADVKQCTLENEADHILGALFLRRFVRADKKDPDWIHLDLASGNHKGGLAHIPTDVTGFGVRLTLELLLEQKLI